MAEKLHCMQFRMLISLGHCCLFQCIGCQLELKQNSLSSLAHGKFRRFPVLWNFSHHPLHVWAQVSFGIRTILRGQSTRSNF